MIIHLLLYSSIILGKVTALLEYAPMLLWLGESLGVSRAELKKASEAALAAGDRFAAQCAAVRSVIPWTAIEERIAGRK